MSSNPDDAPSRCLPSSSTMPSLAPCSPPDSHANNDRSSATESATSPYNGFSRVSPFVRPEPSDSYLARCYGIVSPTTTTTVFSPDEDVLLDDLRILLAMTDKHIALWDGLAPSRPAARAVDALTGNVRSTITALMDAVCAHSVVRMCAILYGRDMALLADAFSAPTPSYESEPAVALRACIDADQALFRRHFARAIRGIRALWLAHDTSTNEREHTTDDTAPLSPNAATQEDV